MHFTELDLYAIFYRIARGWPATYDADNNYLAHKRLNCFAAIDTVDDMAAENLGKDGRYKPDIGGEVFYSRYWEDHGYLDEKLKRDYPMLLVWEMPGVGHDLLTAQEEVISFRAGIFDLYVGDFDPGAYVVNGRQRTREAIKNDLRNLRTQFFGELRKWVKVETKRGSDPWQWELFNEDYLQTLLPDVISEYRNCANLGDVLRVQDSEMATEADVDVTDGLVATYFSFGLSRTCGPADVVIDHEGNYTGAATVEQLDHPTNASA